MSDAKVSADAVTLVFSQADVKQMHVSQTASVSVDIAGVSHKGRVRSRNQDHFLIGRIERSLKVLDTNVPEYFMPQSHSETAYGIVVADGMGGAAAGDVASRLAIRTLLEEVVHTPDWIMRASDGGFDEVLARQQERFDQISKVLQEFAENHLLVGTMGTTLTVAASLGLYLTIAHVGDSRAYLCRHGELKRLTKDQTLVQDMIDAGQLFADKAQIHPQRHVLTGAITTGNRPLNTELLRLELLDGDCLMVCSDGLTGMVPEPMIADVLRGDGPAQTDCDTLLQLALEAGGVDNVTVTVARYRKNGDK